MQARLHHVELRKMKTKNALDSLVERIPDPALRQSIEVELRALRSNREFGLVFERHFPENVLLPSYPVRRGSLVKLRGASTPEDVGIVTQIAAPNAAIRMADGELRHHHLDELVVIKRFGESIYPGLSSLGSINDDAEGRPHVVINGENYHVLQSLTYIYEGLVDCIYIDPPYNSGARDWKYNNDYVAKDDAYRHSKWLSFMEKRLLLARRLLNPAKSVLIVAIDENEVHRLNLLLQQLFPASKIQMVSVLINPAGVSIIDQFSRVDEHLLFVHVGNARPARTTAQTTPLQSDGAQEEIDKQPKEKKITWESLQRSGGNSRRKDTKAKFFPIYVDPIQSRIVGCGDHLPWGTPRSKAPRPPKGVVAVWPIKTDGSEACWQLSAPTFRKYLEAGRIRIGRKKAEGSWGVSFLTKGHMRAIATGEFVVKGKDKNGALEVYFALDRLRTRVGKTLWTNGSYSATEHGSTLLRKFLPGRKFPFPKSLYAVEDALRFYVGDNKEAIVLDFFGGSGTTTHAVARLNSQDGGRRQSILVTNNEVSAEEAEELRANGYLPGDPEWEARGIFEYITRPRIEAALSGRDANGIRIDGNYRFIDEFPMADGFRDRAIFLKLAYLDPDSVSRGKAFESIAHLLWLKAGAIGPVINRVVQPFAAPKDGRYAILFDIAHWHSFVAKVRERSHLSHVFIVTDSRAQFQAIVAELPVELETVMLYEDYLLNFELPSGIVE